MVEHLFGYQKNCVGTIDFSMKLKGMRKIQEFTAFGLSSNEKVLTIQSDTRIGQIDLNTGGGIMSKPHSSGAYFHHLNFDKLTLFKLSADQLKILKSHLYSSVTEPRKGLCVTTDNNGAINIFNL